MTTSLSFADNISSYLVIPYNSDLDFGLGDFTIEWYQYETDSNAHPRPFSRGTYLINPGATIAVSIESDGYFYLWYQNIYIISFSVNVTASEWNHFAICRSSGITQVFMNGVSQGSVADTNNYTSTDNLTIGNESDRINPDVTTPFGGYMTYFAWNKGYARYTTNFTVSDTYPPILPSTVLMLSAYSNSGTQGRNVINSNVGTYASAPVNFNPDPTKPPTQLFYRMVGSLYSDNTKFYKPNSLSSSIGSTVRNSRAVARRT
jgi:hypothetical protein